MLKLAMIDGAGAFHARAFAGLINRIDREAFTRHNWPVYDNHLGDKAVITHVWDEDAKVARQLAKAANIDHVLDKPADVIGKVDGVLLTDNLVMTHQRHAPVFLRAGVPTFIDKPLAPTLRQAQSIVKLAEKHDTPMTSCSALRYATEIADRDALAERVGDIAAVTCAGVNELFFYGIHPLTLMYTLMQSRIVSVRHVGTKEHNIVRVRFADGRMGVLMVYSTGMAFAFTATVHGSGGHERIAVTDSAGFYSRMLDDFLTSIASRKPAVPYDETLNIIAALLASKRSLRERRECRV